MIIATVASFLGFFILFGEPATEVKEVEVKQSAKVEAALSSSNYKRLR